MAQLTFISTDFAVGVGEDFFAFGEQENFELQALHWEEDAPSVSDMRLRWRISTGLRPVDDYEASAQLRAWPTGHRRSEIAKWNAEPSGYLWAAENDVLDLAVLFPRDSGIIELLSAACANRAPISFFSNDLHFGREGLGDGAFPSIDGFRERHEPSFLGRRPVIRIEPQ